MDFKITREMCRFWIIWCLFWLGVNIWIADWIGVMLFCVVGAIVTTLFKKLKAKPNENE